MCTFLLIRHGLCDHVGRELAGRRADVHLNEAGRTQAVRLAEQLRDLTLDCVISSPLPRARETAEPLVQGRQLPLQIDDRLTEIDYGEWTGKQLTELAGIDSWSRYNALRSVTRIPQGELMLEVQSRAISALEDRRKSYPDGRCAVFTHGDVIRSAVAHFAGIPLDLFHRLEIAPASVSVVVVSEQWIGVRAVNLLHGGLRELF